MRGATEPKKKAPQTTLTLLAAYEVVVVNPQRPRCQRMFAWYRCVRCWAAVRFDDHRGMLPQLVHLLPSGLRGTLVRTKATGAGKKRGQLDIIVGREVYISEPKWLSEGWALWK